MESVRILSFDPGTENTGYSFGEGRLALKEYHLSRHFGVIKTSKKDGDVRQRIDIIGERMTRLFKLLQPTHIVLEDFTEQGKLVGTTYKEMSWLLEHMRMVARYNGFEARIYENAEWKKIAMGSSHLNKDQIKHFVSHRVQGEGIALLRSKKHPTHIWDSVGIGYARLVELSKGGK